MVCEMIADGAIGPVHEVQVWSPARFWSWPTWDGRPPETPPVPMDWIGTCGSAPRRSGRIIRRTARGRGETGGISGPGLLGRSGLPQALHGVQSLEARAPDEHRGQRRPSSARKPTHWAKSRFEFPARNDLPPVVLTGTTAG